MKGISFGTSIQPSAVVAVLVLVCQACATGPGVPTGTSRPQPQSPAPSRVVPSSMPSTQPSTVTTLQLADGGTMFPGTYKTKFDPAMTITITDVVDLDCVPGYRCRGDIDVNLPQWVAFEFGNVHGSELDIMRIDKVYSGSDGTTVAAPPNDYAAWLLSRPGVIRLAAPVPVTIGGVHGVRLDFRVDRQVTYGPTGLPDPPAFGICCGARTWISLIRVHDRVIIVVETLGPENTVGDFDAAMHGLQPVVDTIRWE
jgi:hypothetical protein